MADLDGEVHRELIAMPEKITSADLRDMRGVLIYCSDYRCSHVNQPHLKSQRFFRHAISEPTIQATALFVAVLLDVALLVCAIVASMWTSRGRIAIGEALDAGRLRWGPRELRGPMD